MNITFSKKILKKDTTKDTKKDTTKDTTKDTKFNLCEYIQNYTLTDTKKNIYSDILIFFEDDDVYIKYGINPHYLYSYKKQDDYDINSFSDFIKGGVSSIPLSTRHINPRQSQKDIITDFINFHFNNINRPGRSKTIVGIHFPFIFDTKTYYIEFSIKQDNKLIISVKNNPRIRDDLIHISFFNHSFVHTTFLDTSSNHFRLYYLTTPTITNRFNDILDYVMNSNDIFVNKDSYLLDFWNNNPNNNWRLLISNPTTNPATFILFQDNLHILISAIRHLTLLYPFPSS